MSLLDLFRHYGRAKTSNNNRKPTKGRISYGKNTFKGSEAEHRLVKRQKQIDELARMMFAVDVKLKEAKDSNKHLDVISSLQQERNMLEADLGLVIDIFREEASKRRYNSFMNALDQDDIRRRKNWGLKAA